MHTPDFEVHRAVVHSADPVTGSAYVRIPALLGATQVVSIPTTGLTNSDGFWNVPSVGSSVFVAVSDDRTQFYWLTAVGISGSGGDDPSNEPIGHEDRTGSLIAFDNATRTFNIQPAADSYVVWCVGLRYEKTSLESIQIPNTTGLYYISFNSQGQLQYSTSYFLWDQDCPTAYVYWNSATQRAEFFADERHGITMDWQTHEYLHRTRGAAYANGFDASNFDTSTQNGNTDAQAKLDIDNGTFFDEDLQVDVRHSLAPAQNTWEQQLQGPARIPVFYRSGTSYVYDAPTDFPVKQGTSHPRYNSSSGGNWSTTELGANSYGIQWIVATNQLNYPILSIMGQTQYANVGQAEAASWADMDLDGLPIVEIRVLYKIVFRATGSNTPGCYFEQVDDYRNALSNATSTAAAVVDHGNLTGLADDDHPQYLTSSRADLLYADINASPTITLAGDATGSVTLTNLDDGTLTVTVVNDSHTHDGRYYTETESDSRYVNVSGDTMTGALTVTGDITAQAEIYLTNWLRLTGEKGIYSQSYGQHFYPDAGGFYWDLDGPLRVRSGYEGGIQGYLGYHDGNGFGLLHSGGSWWLNTQNNYKTLTIGGSQALNAHSSDTGIRLMLGGGDADAQSNYYIGTNKENYGGNYNKLDMFWHTGIRMAAMRVYGGIRMYGSITGGVLSDELFSVGKGDGNVRVTNTLYVGDHAISAVPGTGNPYGSISVGGAMSWDGYAIDQRVVFMHDGGSAWGIYNDVNNHWMIYGTLGGGVELRYNNTTRLWTDNDGGRTTGRHYTDGSNYAYSYYGHSNIAGTGNAIHTPNGIYSTGTNWLYGSIITNNNSIDVGSSTFNHTNGQANFYKNQTNGYPLYHSEAPIWLRCGNNYGFSIGGWPGPSGGVANQFVWAYADSTIYVRNWDNGGYAGLAGVLSNVSTRRIKKDIVDFRPSSLSASANRRYATDLVGQLRTVEYVLNEDNDGLSRIPDGMYDFDEEGNPTMNERRRVAYERLQSYAARTGESRYNKRHVCGQHCDGSVDDPCYAAVNGQRRRPGLIAEEIHAVLPGAVSVDSTKQAESVDVMALIGLLVASNQELAERLDMLESASS